MRVGFIQPAYVGADQRPAPEAAIRFMLEELGRATPGLIVLPEYANCVGVTDVAELRQAAEPSRCEPFLHQVLEVARQRQVAVAVNVLQRLGQGLVNVTWFFAGDGQRLGRYVKTHLSPFEAETLGLVPGNAATVLEWNGVRIGFLTCFDIYFAEFAERLAALRPDLVAFPSYQRAEPAAVLARQAAGRALDLEAYVVRASCSMGRGSPAGGHSLIVGPDGDVLLAAGQETGLFTLELDPLHKRPRPRAYGLAPVPARQIVEDARRPGLYRTAGPGLGSKADAPYPRVVAHRGLSGLCPENTLPAFAAAMALGADEIELDLWASRDGELVVCHDPTVDRTSNGRGRICDLTWAEIRALDFGAWFGAAWRAVPCCRLEEVFAFCGGRVVMNLHIKEPGPDGLVVRRTRDLAAGHGLLRDVYIAGERDVLDCAVKLAPEVARCCLEGAGKGAAMLDCALEYGCARVQFWNPNLTPADIARAHANGVVCNLFFGHRPDTAEEADRLYALSLDAVLTNWANQVLPVARARRGPPAGN